MRTTSILRITKDKRKEAKERRDARSIAAFGYSSSLERDEGVRKYFHPHKNRGVQL